MCQSEAYHQTSHTFASALNGKTGNVHTRRHPDILANLDCSGIMLTMYYLYIVTGSALVVSLIASREKTLKALKIAGRRLLKILPAFLLMLVLVSVVLYLIPEATITQYLAGSNKFHSFLIASAFGSIMLMPGFIVFPLAGILVDKGAPYMVIASFSTSLMMVGILTYPIEKAYLGARVTIIRNLLSFIIALAVAIVIGIVFGEIF